MGILKILKEIAQDIYKLNLPVTASALVATLVSAGILQNPTATAVAGVLATVGLVDAYLVKAKVL